jgi:large subunit ribosomal protein L18
MQKRNKQQARTLRVRSSIKSVGRPRLQVYRSSRHIWAQIIDDLKHETVAAVGTKTLKSVQGDTKTMQAASVGTEIARLAIAKKITKIVFDRGAYKYHGRVKAVAQAARAAGLEF